MTISIIKRAHAAHVFITRKPVALELADLDTEEAGEVFKRGGVVAAYDREVRLKAHFYAALDYAAAIVFCPNDYRGAGKLLRLIERFALIERHGVAEESRRGAQAHAYPHGQRTVNVRLTRGGNAVIAQHGQSPRSDKYGYCNTSSADSLIEWRIEHGLREIDINRLDIERGTGNGTRAIGGNGATKVS